ncbi:hypothetical protein LTR94_024657 [Friedmanniomyces endolithicus]|nr:hypothetical protein LTR94_024657 [Friedmanniomyces endolithicus]
MSVKSTLVLRIRPSDGPHLRDSAQGPRPAGQLDQLPPPADRLRRAETEPDMTRLPHSIALGVVLTCGLAACGRDPQTIDRSNDAKPKPAIVLTQAQKAQRLASLPAPYNLADLENGRRAFARCRACHTIGEGGPDLAGPNLYGVFGRKAGDRPRYSYSNALRSADFTWDAVALDHWLQNPKTYLPGNKMTFPGLADAIDRRDVIAFLKVETGFEAPVAEPAASPSSEPTQSEQTKSEPASEPAAH